MPSMTKTTAAADMADMADTADTAAKPHFSAPLLEQLIAGPVTPAELEGIFHQFKKSVLERVVGGQTGRGCCELVVPSGASLNAKVL